MPSHFFNTFAKRVVAGLLLLFGIAVLSVSFAHAQNLLPRVSTGTDLVSGMLKSKITPLVEDHDHPDIEREPGPGHRKAAATAAAEPEPSVAAAATWGPNLIANPSVESGTTGTGALPTNWNKGGYGTNTRILTYPATPAEDGTRAIKVAITSYTSGDAKWYPTPTGVTPGMRYRFSNWSQANVPSEINAQVQMLDGTYRYIVLANLPASATYQNTVAEFTAPAGAFTVTIFHVIKQVGTLTVDNYSLEEETDETNLVTNGNFETVGATASQPLGWSRGGWGTNARTLTYPASGVTGSRAARVAITSYTSGDAKWYFTPIALSNGVYTYSDVYQSNVPSLVVAEFRKTDGSYLYETIATDPPANTLTEETIGFIVPRGVSTVTVYRLINQVGTLTIDNVAVRRSEFTSGVFQNGAVTLTFDDGLISHYNTVVPKLNQYGFKGTFYIITRQLADYGFSGFVSRAQIEDMYADGQEIGAHTLTHRPLSTLSYADQEREIRNSRQELLAMNVGPINSFAYPFGDYNETTTTLVRNTGYTNARSTISGDANPLSNRYELPRRNILNSTTVGEVKGWIDEAVANKSWLIIAFHPVDNSGAEYAMTPSNFNQVIDYLATQNVSVATMEQGQASLAQ